MNSLRCLVLTAVSSTLALAAEHTFEKVSVSSEFWSEGADVADFDHDGQMDICAGPFVWWGPDFKNRSAYSAPKPDPKQPLPDADYEPNFARFQETAPAYAGKAYNPLSYSDYFLSYQYDFNSDGWADIAVFSWPGDIAAWYENPQKRDSGKAWKRHVLLDQADNESPQLGDITGDGKPELICHTAGRLGYATLNWHHPEIAATYHPISKPDIKRYFRYTHGYGFGDVNGDGRGDILDKDGWREQPATASDEWKEHLVDFAHGSKGGAQMQVYDVDGDKDADVISSWNGHGYGLSWFEQKDGAFTEHQLMGATEAESPHGVKFSQLHATTMADMNGDGVKDLITGKRYWAHGPNKDDEPGAPAVLYWFQIHRSEKGVDFIPHQIDADSGVGTQVTAADVNQDKKLDVVVSNKKGIAVFLQK